MIKLSDQTLLPLEMHSLSCLRPFDLDGKLHLHVNNHSHLAIFRDDTLVLNGAFFAISDLKNIAELGMRRLGTMDDEDLLAKATLRPRELFVQGENWLVLADLKEQGLGNFMLLPVDGDRICTD